MNVLCLKLRARKTWAPPPAAPKVACNAPRHLITKCLWKEKEGKMSPPLQITEDTPPDMLAGSMDLCVMLPNGHTVKMSVERSTPMMDLLVQVTTANKISPAGHMIQALGERGVMPYKPSTPIGALDTWTIHIVPKNQAGQTANRKVPFKPVNQPFEKTFRLQVHLPRNQLYVTRISPKTKLSDILIQVCNEKNLDSSKYSLRHPVNLDQVLNLSYCLADYKLQEVALVSNRSRPLGASSVDIMSLQQTDNAGYNFNMTRNNRSCDGSMSSGSLGGRSLSPTRSDGSSASPPPVVPPNRPIRKRRPAPKPPVAVNNNNNNNNINNSSNKINSIDNNSNKCEQMQSSSQGPQGTVICHSRNSSDSSGYHEASVLSESPESNSLPDSLPRRSKLPSANVTESNASKVATNLSRSLSNLTAAGSNVTPSMKSHSISTTSLVSITGRKKKAAPLPPLLKPKMSSVSEETPKQRTPSVSSTASSSATLEENDHNIPRKSSTLPASIRVAQPSSKTEPVEPDSQQSSNLVNETPSSSLDRFQEPVEQPKPKPRTVFQTDSVASDVCTKPVGDGSQPTKTSVNTTLPRKSRKSYPAPAPKPKNSVTSESSSIVTSENSTKNDSSQNRIVSGNSVIENNIERKSDVLNERRVDRVKSADDSFSNDKSQETETSSDFDTESLHSSASSVFIKTDSSEKETLLKKLKEFPSGTNLNHKTDNSNKGRNFSVGNIEDVPDFLSDSSHLGRWKNMECLPEACATLNACGTGQCSESELEDEKKVDSNSDLRLDDDEIDRIFHNATRDHASLESGVGDEPPLSLLSLPSPPSSLTNQPELAVVNNNNDALDWEYKLPAPPTFRDETNSPTVTEFDTVTIGNLTEVFGPESIMQTENKKKVNKAEPDLVNSQNINNENSLKPNQINKEKTELVVSKPTENKNKLVEKSQMDILSEDSIKIKTLGHVFAANDSTKPDLLKHSLVNEKPQSPTEVEKSAVINELSSVITERLNKPEVRLVEMENSVKTRNSSDVKQTSALDNFVITTYTESKPIEVFEDDSIKSSNGERRDSSRDEAMFRAPKSVPRRFEPNLTRRSSFSSDDKPYNNITVKRSVSHVSLLAGNVARSPYRSHLARSNGALTETSRLSEETEKIGSRLRKTASEINISQGIGDSKLGDWRTGDTVGLQSLQVLRSILPQLSHSQNCMESIRTENVETINNSDRVTSVSDKKFESKLSDHKEEESSNDSSTTSKRYSYSGPPTINLTTWSERPKRQVSIKMDRDYCFGFGKLKSNSLDETETKDSTKSNETTNGFSTMVTQHSNSRLDEKPDIVKHSNDLSHVPIVRAVELKKPYSTNTIDTTDFNRCGFYNGRSYENLNNIENDSRPHSVHQSSFGSTVSIASKSSSNIKLNSEPIDEERISSVTSLAKRFGQAKVRPSSCYLYGSSSNNHNTQEKPIDKNEEICVKSTNTSRVFLNASDNKKFTSIVGINGVENNSNTDSVNNNYNNKTEIKIVQRPQLQTSKVIIGGDNNNYINNKAVGFKVNGNMSINNTSNNINNHKAESNRSSSDVRAQSKLSSGGYSDETVKVASFRNNVSNTNYNNTNKLSHNPSLKQQTTFMPVVKGFRKPENEQLTGNNNSGGGGIPPPPPVMPVLKPIGERRQVKTLPPPQADPRDQLLASIRNFGGANKLRKITSK